MPPAGKVAERQRRGLGTHTDAADERAAGRPLDTLIKWILSLKQ